MNTFGILNDHQIVKTVQNCFPMVRILFVPTLPHNAHPRQQTFETSCQTGAQVNHQHEPRTWKLCQFTTAVQADGFCSVEAAVFTSPMHLVESAVRRDGCRSPTKFRRRRKRALKVDAETLKTFVVFSCFGAENISYCDLQGRKMNFTNSKTLGWSVPQRALLLTAARM